MDRPRLEAIGTTVRYVDADGNVSDWCCDAGTEARAKLFAGAPGLMAAAIYALAEMRDYGIDVDMDSFDQLYEGINQAGGIEAFWGCYKELRSE